MQVNTVEIPGNATICNAGVPVAARKQSHESVGCKSENCKALPVQCLFTQHCFFFPDPPYLVIYITTS